MAVAALVGLAWLSVLMTPRGATAQEVSSAVQQLADTYAPIAMMRAQDGTCDKNGDGYFPAPVDWIFGNPEILLRANAGGDVKNDPVLLKGFSPQDLAAAGPGTYIDFPNDPHSPGCAYETTFKQATATYGLEPTTYTRVVIDEGKRKLYLQYWFWYLFNDWNNLHESDWEMIQLVFNATTPEEALTYGPDEVGFAQHEGGELVRWSDDQLQREETHLLVYPGAGSHATYPSSDLFISWGERGSGFGCDNTTGPSVRTPLQAVVVPDPVDPTSSSAWALFQGRWGQRGEPLFNGPLGPNLTLKWADPAAATVDWGSTSLTVPGGRSVGFDPTQTFCSFTEYGSRAAARLISHPLLAALLSVALLALLAVCIYFVWGHLLEALDIYGNELATFFGIGLVAIPIGFLFQVGVSVLEDVSPFDKVLGWVGGSGGAAFTAASVVGGLQQAAMLLLVVPAVVQAMKCIRRGERPTVVGCYKSSFQHLPTNLTAWAIYFLLIASVGVSIVMLPFAIYFGITMQFYVQGVILEHDSPGWNALLDSWRTTRSQLLRSLYLSLPFLIVAALPGPVIGITFLIAGGSRIGFANFASGFLYALLIPYAYIGLTMAWRRLRNEAIVEPQMLTQRPTRTADVEMPPQVAS